MYSILASSSSLAGYGGPGRDLASTGGDPINVFLVGVLLVLLGLLIIGCVRLTSHYKGS